MPSEKVVVTTPTDREVVITRSFDAPRKLIWECHTKPELVHQWLHRLVGVWLGATAVVPLRRPGLGLGGLQDDAYRMAALTGRGMLGLEVYFP